MKNKSIEIRPKILWKECFGGYCSFVTSNLPGRIDPNDKIKVKVIKTSQISGKKTIYIEVYNAQTDLSFNLIIPKDEEPFIHFKEGYYSKSANSGFVLNADTATVFQNCLGVCYHLSQFCFKQGFNKTNKSNLIKKLKEIMEEFKNTIAFDFEFEKE